MRRINKIIPIICASVMVMSLAACGQQSINGKWSCQQNGAATTYEFNADGTGSMDLGEGIVLPINYSYEDNKLKISYTFLGMESTVEYNVVIDKKTLTLNNSSSNITLEKQN